MNDIINLAIILDFSFFKNTKNLSQKLIHELSKFILISQTWSNQHSNKKSKLNICFEISSFQQKSFFKRQYFREFDKNLWMEIVKNIQYQYNIDGNIDEMSVDSEYEKGFFAILQKFSTNFCWESSDLYSPFQSQTIAYENRPVKNIALYITPEFYPLQIVSKNTLKVLINKLNSYGISMVWMSCAPSTNHFYHSICHTFSLFNGFTVSFNSEHSISSSFYIKFIGNLAPVKINKPSQIDRSRMISINKHFQEFSITIKTNTHEFPVILQGIQPPNFLTLFTSYVKHDKPEASTFKQYIIMKTPVIEQYLGSTKIIFLWDGFLEWTLQFLSSQNIYLLFQPHCNFDIESFSWSNKDDKSIFDVIQSWFTHTDAYRQSDNVFEKYLNSCHTCSETSHFLSACLNGDHITYRDSKDCTELKKSFGYINDQSNQNDSKEITKGYDRFETIYNEISRIHQQEIDKYSFFESLTIPVADLVAKHQAKDTDNYSAIKLQLLLRLYIVNKFNDQNKTTRYINEIINLLRKMSVWKLPAWVGQFLNHNVMHANYKKNDQLKIIYDALCYPYPNFMRSPSPCLKQESFTAIDNISTQSTLCLNLKRNNNKELSKRREININLNGTSFRSNSRKLLCRTNSCKNVRRSLFGTNSDSSIKRTKSHNSCRNVTVFRISPESSYSLCDNGMLQIIVDSQSNPNKFYLPQTHCNLSLFENSASSRIDCSDVSIGDKSALSPSIIHDFSLSRSRNSTSPRIVKEEVIFKTPENKIFEADASLYDSTPFKFYQLTQTKQLEERLQYSPS